MSQIAVHAEGEPNLTDYMRPRPRTWTSARRWHTYPMPYEQHMRSASWQPWWNFNPSERLPIPSSSLPLPFFFFFFFFSFFGLVRHESQVVRSRSGEHQRRIATSAGPACVNPAMGETRNEMLRFATGTSEELYHSATPPQAGTIGKALILGTPRCRRARATNGCTRITFLSPVCNHDSRSIFHFFFLSRFRRFVVVGS